MKFSLVNDKHVLLGLGGALIGGVIGGVILVATGGWPLIVVGSLTTLELAFSAFGLVGLCAIGSGILTTFISVIFERFSSSYVKFLSFFEQDSPIQTDAAHVNPFNSKISHSTHNYKEIGLPHDLNNLVLDDKGGEILIREENDSFSSRDIVTLKDTETLADSALLWGEPQEVMDEHSILLTSSTLKGAFQTLRTLGEDSRVEIFNKIDHGDHMQGQALYEAKLLVLKQQYRQSALLCHPDKVVPEEREQRTEQFKALNQLYGKIQLRWRLALQGINCSLYSNIEVDEFELQEHEMLKGLLRDLYAAAERMEAMFKSNLDKLEAGLGKNKMDWEDFYQALKVQHAQDISNMDEKHRQTIDKINKTYRQNMDKIDEMHEKNMNRIDKQSIKISNDFRQRKADLERLTQETTKAHLQQMEELEQILQEQNAQRNPIPDNSLPSPVYKVCQLF